MLDIVRRGYRQHFIVGRYDKNTKNGHGLSHVTEKSAKDDLERKK